MKKIIIVYLLISIITTIGGCSTEKHHTPTITAITINKDKLRENTTSVENTGEKLMPIDILKEDIIGTIISDNVDIGIYLSNYLSGKNLSGYIVAKQLSKGDITTISMATQNNKESCQFEGGSCITFIIKKGKIIRSNIERFLQCSIKNECFKSQYGGLVYRYTKNGVLLEIKNGEGLMCQGGTEHKFTYINLPSLLTFYSTLFISYKGISPDPKDEFCNNKDTKRIKSESLSFFKSLEDQISATQLNIKAKTTEEAFYKYHSQ